VNERDLTRLLHEAVPPIPRDIANPPLATIRRLARHRQAVLVLAAAGLVGVVVGVGGVVVAAPWQGAGPVRPGGSTTPTSTVPTTPLPNATEIPTPAGSVRAAVVSRDSTEVTIYVNPDYLRCITFPNVQPSVDERPDRVIVTYRGEGEATECERTVASPHVVTLAEPLGDRLMVDGDGTTIRPFFEAGLPVLPAEWEAIPSDYGSLDGTWFTWGFQKYGVGPNRQVQISAGAAATPRHIVEEVDLGSRIGLLFDGPNYPGVRWTAGDLTYEMRVIPNEGDAEILDGVRLLIDEFNWP